MIIKSGLWSIAGSAVEKLMLLATYVLVSRQVDKEQFGYLVIVFLIVEFLGYIASFGVGENILRRKEMTASFLASSYYFVVRVALLMVLLMIAVAAPVAYFVYGSELFFLVLLMSIHPLFTCINSFYLALIQRDLRYKELAVRTAVVSFTSGLTGVLLALSGAGVVSMVAGRYVQAIADFFWLRRISRYRNDDIHSAGEVKEIARFGLPLSAAQVFNFGSSRFYEVFITIVFGPAVLATLDVGRKFLLTFYRLVFTPLNSVVLSYVSQSDSPGKAYFKFVAVVQLVALPIICSLGFLSYDVIGLFFGEDWSESASVLLYFSYAGIAQSVVWFLPQLALAYGKSKIVFSSQLLGFFVVVVILMGGLLYGVDEESVFLLMSVAIFSSSIVLSLYVFIALEVSVFLLIGLLSFGVCIYSAVFYVERLFLSCIGGGEGWERIFGVFIVLFLYFFSLGCGWLCRGRRIF